MTKKAKTINLQGKEYAQVAERLRMFREDCPNGLIETTPTITENQAMFKAKVLKDKSNPNSAEAVAHSVGEMKGQKAFEKLETIAVGRALAMLGYLASGEVASSDEMEDFMEYKVQKIEEAKLALKECTTIDDLKKVFLGLGNLMTEPALVKLKDELKLKLTQNENTQ
jgi:hypothetical protein